MENRKENRSWYKGSRIAVSVSIALANILFQLNEELHICVPFDPNLTVYQFMQVLDDTFASHMQQLLGNALQEKDLEPPRSIMEVRSMLCKDAPNHKDSTYYY